MAPIETYRGVVYHWRMDQRWTVHRRVNNVVYYSYFDLSSSSVRYEIGIFRNDAPRASAQGHFVHLYVDRASNRPTPLQPSLRAALEALA